MTQTEHREGLQLQSTITQDGRLELTLATVESPALGEGDILIRVEASPINPSDLGLLFGPADMTKAIGSKDAAGRPAVTAPVPPGLMKMVKARIDQSMPVGNEGAGIVVAAGSSEAAQALIGKTVSAVGGGMYSQYRAAPAAMCLEMPEGTTPREAASWFVNPLTALGMVETMRMEGHNALVHTAAASNLGQMLNKICLADDIPLVNIVRKPEQEEILKKIGAKHICNSSAPDFRDRLTDALVETGATLVFDAIRGGKLVGQILSSMEIALNRSAKEYSRYD